MKSIITAAFVLAASPLHGATLITSSYGTVSGADDNNQAGPIRGVSYKILSTGTYSNNIGTGSNVHALSASDPAATGVEFQSLTWQRSGSTTMNGTWYIGIFSGLTVDTNGNVTSLGTLIGASTNSVVNPGANAAMAWSFNNVPLTVGATYQFAFTTTATPTLTTDIGAGQLELNTGGHLSETELVAGNATTFTNRAGWEPVFSMTYNAIPEPASALLGGIGVILLMRRRRL